MTCKLDLGIMCQVLRSMVSAGSESVGYLLGLKENASALIMARNVRGSSLEFEADPRDTYIAHIVADNLGLDVIALFHTHPGGLPRPSLVDLDGMKLWPLPWIIASPEGIGAYILKDGELMECRISCSR